MNKKTQGKEMSRVVAKCNPAEPIELSDEAMDKVAGGVFHTVLYGTSGGFEFWTVSVTRKK